MYALLESPMRSCSLHQRYRSDRLTKHEREILRRAERLEKEQYDAEVQQDKRIEEEFEAAIEKVRI